MLFLKRLLTSFALFLVLWVALFLGALAVAGGVVGARAAATNGATDFESGYAAGHEAGHELGRKYGMTILLVAFGVSAVSSVAISFSGLLPWCRRKPQPPPLPPGLN
jgi:NADH:ubiquinone oxidoreductase subunit 3 (subunit A)